VNTLFLRLEAHLQSYANCERFNTINTNLCPTKSAVMGMMLAAHGIKRDESRQALEYLNRLKMGVRIDRRGEITKEFQVLRPPILQADGDMRIHPHITHRTYLADANFLVALQGDPDQIRETAAAVQNPNFPIFLGRSFCIPYKNLFHAVGNFSGLESALSSVESPTVQRLSAVVEQPVPDKNSELARDVLVDCKNQLVHTARYVKHVVVEAVCCSRSAEETKGKIDPKARDARMVLDRYLCVCCGMRAAECHHITYVRFGAEKVEDLRSLCKPCHAAVTSLEYTLGMHDLRIDPLIPSWRRRILELKVSSSC
jgi:CRISPR-associated protein Cas5/CasD subtype I-E